jgi:hypothetical protein
MAQVIQNIKSKVMTMAWVNFKRNLINVAENDYEHKRILWSGCLRWAWKCYLYDRVDKMAKFEMVDHKADPSDKVRAWIARVEITPRRVYRDFVTPTNEDGIKHFWLEDGLYEISDPIDVDSVDRYFAQVIGQKVIRHTLAELRARA